MTKGENIEVMKKKVRLFETFTKLWVTILLVLGIVDLQLSYLLAFLGREQIAETLSVAVVTEILGVSAVYMIKSFLETKQEKKQELAEREFEAMLNEAKAENSQAVSESGSIG